MSDGPVTAETLAAATVAAARAQLPGFQAGQRVDIWGDDVGTVIDGPHPDWNGCYRVAIDGDGLNYVAPRAMSPVDAKT